MNRVFCILLCSCNGLIYENDSYSLFADKVVQGEYTSVAEPGEFRVSIGADPRTKNTASFILK